MNTKELLAIAPEIKAALFGGLARVVDYPDEDLVGGLFDASLTDELGQALNSMGLTEISSQFNDMQRFYAQNTDAENCLLDLQKEYTRLCFYSKPRMVNLFESVFRKGKLFQDVAFNIARLYYDAGLQYDQQMDLPPDHIAAELEFMAYLGFQEAKQKEAKNQANLDYARELQTKVLNEHLHGFAGHFARQLKKSAQSKFYALAADLLLILFEPPAEPAA